MAVQNIKSVLIGFSREDNTPSHALSYGLSLARQAGAHATLAALAPEMTVTHAFVSDVAAGLVAAENERLRGIAEAAVEQARQDANAAGVPCAAEVVQDHYSILTTLFAKRARVHDVTVFDTQPDALSLSRGILEEALFSSGRPMLIVPQGIGDFRAEKIMVAWDGSSRATRAVNDALPFLKAAREVEIVCVSGEKDLSKSVLGAELAPHLTRHGINCTVKELVAKDGDAGATLRSQAGLFGADMLVMGAFVHSRLRQLVLGGVTQSMLKSCQVPLLLSY